MPDETPQHNPDEGRPSDEEVQAARDAIRDGESKMETNPDTPAIRGPVDTSLGQDQVQEQMLADQEQGFRGNPVDPTPNEHYSLQTPPDAPTPETDPELAAQAREASYGNHLTAVETPSHLLGKSDKTSDEDAA